MIHSLQEWNNTCRTRCAADPELYGIVLEDMVLIWTEAPGSERQAGIYRVGATWTSRSKLGEDPRCQAQQTWSILIGSHDYVWSQSKRQSHKSEQVQGLIWCFQLSALIQLTCFWPFIASGAALVVYKTYPGKKNQNKNGKKTTTVNSFVAKSKSILVYRLFNQCFLTDQRAWILDSRLKKCSFMEPFRNFKLI